MPVMFQPSGPGLWAIPGARDITKAANAFELARARMPVHTYKLGIDYVIKQYFGGFTKVILDLSPAVDDPTNDAALFAADQVLVPLSVESMSIDGVQELLQTITESNSARAGIGLPGQTHLFALVACRVIADQQPEVGKLFGALNKINIPYFDQCIPYTTAGWKAPQERIPISVYAPGDAAATPYQVLASRMTGTGSGRVWAIANSKGGVGKTTSTFELGYSLAEQGERVLVLDLDGQRSLTKIMNLLPKPGQSTIYAVLTDPTKDAGRAVVPYLGTPSHPIAFAA